MICMVGMRGFVPPAPCSRSRCANRRYGEALGEVWQVVWAPYLPVRTTFYVDSQEMVWFIRSAACTPT